MHYLIEGFPFGSADKDPPAMWEPWVWSLGWGDPLEKGKATHSSILAWRIPWTLWSTGSKRVRRDFHFHLLIYLFWPLCRACRILLLLPGIKPVPPALRTQSLNHWTIRKSPSLSLFAVELMSLLSGNWKMFLTGILGLVLIQCHSLRNSHASNSRHFSNVFISAVGTDLRYARNSSGGKKKYNFISVLSQFCWSYLKHFRDLYSLPQIGF